MRPKTWSLLFAKFPELFLYWKLTYPPIISNKHMSKSDILYLITEILSHSRYGIDISLQFLAKISD